MSIEGTMSSLVLARRGGRAGGLGQKVGSRCAVPATRRSRDGCVGGVGWGGRGVEEEGRSTCHKSWAL